MSITSQIARLTKNISDSLNAVAAKGVTVPSGSNSDDLAGLIAQITSGGGQVIITREQDSAGGEILHIVADNSIDLSETTATASDVRAGKYFFNQNGIKTAGEMTGGGGGIYQDADGYLVLSDEESSGSDTNVLLKLFVGDDPCDYIDNKTTVMRGYNTFYASNIRNISMPELTQFIGRPEHTEDGYYAFAWCTKLTKAYFPKLMSVTTTTSGWKNCITGMFYGCTSLQYADSNTIGGLNTAIGASAFYGCTSLAACDFKLLYNFAATSFTNCSSLKTIIYRGNNVPKLPAITIFDGTPFASDGTGGILYVPSASITEFQSATNWSTILGYENNQILPIEGSIYETQYGDGTPIT